MRKSSEVNIGFPYDSNLICYIAQDLNTKEIRQVENYVREKRDAYFKALNEEIKLFATWPGQYRTDLFEIDDLDAYGKAVKAI